MMTHAQVQADLAEAQENPIYTLPITHREAIEVWKALDDWAGHNEDSLRFMRRLEARVHNDQVNS